ncbi:MAG: nuclear transport factor 2 family protein [Pyrinomonadaceae bacterium]
MADARQPRRTVESILRLEKEIMRHIRAKDTRALERLLTEDFVYRMPGAELSREDFLKGIASVPGRITSVEGEGLRVSVYGETAILTGVQRARVRADDGSEQEGVSAFTDVFVKQNGRWRLALAFGVELPQPAPEPPKP